MINNMELKKKAAIAIKKITVNVFLYQYFLFYVFG